GRGIPLYREVIGRTTTSSAGPRLNWSTEITSAGRLPACSRPWTGFRSNDHTSPRKGWMALIYLPVHRHWCCPTVHAPQSLLSISWDSPSARRKILFLLRESSAAGTFRSPFRGPLSWADFPCARSREELPCLQR